jgi:hypothetical protein
MVNVTSMSRYREMVSVPLPMTTTWKASSYKLVDDTLSPEYVEATPGAVWSRKDPFDAYSPVVDRARGGEAAPHTSFAKLAAMALNFALTDEEEKKLHRMLNLFANRYGLLGLFLEEFGAPLLPEREVGWFVRVAPDALIDGNGSLRDIDPATEGKRLQEELLRERFRRDYAARGELHLWEPQKLILTQKVLILPGELRFEKRVVDFVRSGFSRPSLFSRDPSRVLTYEDVQQRYGVRVVFDRRAGTGVSIVSTREPVGAWLDELRSFGQPLSLRRLNRHLEGVNPRAVVGEDGRLASSWNCPSLLKALHLMRYLDAITGTKIQRCEAPGCYNYFRVGPRGRASMYCPPLPGQKQSRCASRASTAMHRDRQRKRRNLDAD